MCTPLWYDKSRSSVGRAVRFDTFRWVSRFQHLRVTHRKLTFLHLLPVLLEEKCTRLKVSYLLSSVWDCDFLQNWNVSSEFRISFDTNMLSRCEIPMYVNVEMTDFCDTSPSNFVSEEAEVSVCRVHDGEDGGSRTLTNYTEMSHKTVILRLFCISYLTCSRKLWEMETTIILKASWRLWFGERWHLNGTYCNLVR
jgi:hypothetical protein